MAGCKASSMEPDMDWAWISTKLPASTCAGCALKAGHVVTVEPGLYYSGMGGVRLEDVVLVTKTGCENLVKIPKFLEV